MYVRAVVQEGVVEQGILVPQQGISLDPKGNPIALVVGQSDKVEPRVLKIDRAMGNRWLVAEGLKPGDRVIVEGIQKVRPGSPVKVVPFEGQKDAQGPAASQPPAKAP
jgi:membrane fusion protein (multidrug efflux system)